MFTAQDGWEALETAKRLGKSLHAVLADMVMPKMGGTELGTRFKNLLPHITIVYMTGYLEQSDANGASLESAFFLQKPFSREALVAKIAEPLTRERAESAQTHSIVD